MRSMNSSDKALIQRWQQDADGEAFAELVRRHAAMVFGAANRILRNAADAEEIAQESFAKIGEVRRVRGESAGGLLHTIATHLAINRLNAESKRRAREIEYAMLDESVEHSSWATMAPHVDEAIASLSPAQRDAVVRHFLEGESYRAIARAQALDESTVRHHAQRGIERIRKFLQRRGITSAATAIGAALAAEAQAAPVPARLSVALGKQAIAGPAVPSGVSTATATGIGGTAIMTKPLALGLGAAIAIGAGVAGWRVIGVDPAPDLGSVESEMRAERAVSVADTSQSDGGQSEADTVLTDSVDAERSASDPTRESLREIPFEEAERALAELFTKAFGPQDAIGSGEVVSSDWESSFRSEDLPEDNGMHFFLKASELLQDRHVTDLDKWEDFYRRLAAGEAITEDEWAEYAKIQEAIELLRRGLEVGNIALPVSAEGPNTLLPFLAVWRGTARVMALDANYLLAQGDYAGAIGRYESVVQFGNELGRGGPLINGLVGLAVTNIGAEPLVELMTEGSLTSNEYRAIIASLEGAQTQALAHWESLANEQGYWEAWFVESDSSGGAIRTLLGVSYEISDEISAAMLESVPDSQWLRYFNEYREDFDVLLQYSALPYHEALPLLEDYKGYRPNPISDTIMPGMARSLAAYARRDAQLQGAMAVAALEAYRAESGAYPRSLDALVPGYLANPPVDPFTGELLRYQPRIQGYRLYSTGMDMTDDGGLVHDVRKPGTDIVFRR